MILEVILIFAGIAALGSIVNIFMKDREVPQESISVKKYMPGDLPVITLTNNGVALNFLIDTGSNISHICPSVTSLIELQYTKSDVNKEIAGLGALNQGGAVCFAKFKDVLSREYEIELSISKELEETTKYIKKNTGVEIHGLLGTDFLQNYKYVIDFKTLEVYVKS
jgi:hypothetical protein